MSRIFLSHSSKDDFEAVAIRDWLIEEGWDDIFLDLDPTQGIHPGERWERALHEAANRCEAVLKLCTKKTRKNQFPSLKHKS
jgi:hypothetical protein